MRSQTPQSKIAHLETKVDMLETELAYLDHILTQCGFPNGISTLKLTVHEMLADESSTNPLDGNSQEIL